MKHGFDKKTFTAKLFLNDLVYLFVHIPHYYSLSKNKKLTDQFIEKVNNITSSVNGCIYCSWFHAKQAVKSGLTEKEIKEMMQLQFQTNASDFELPALLYAQHYAETNRQPDKEMTENLFDFYGKKTANHIIIMIRRIYFGNLYGNTWEAVMSRLKGKPAPQSSIIFEALFFILNFWFMIPITMIMNRDKAK